MWAGQESSPGATSAGDRAPTGGLGGLPTPSIVLLLQAAGLGLAVGRERLHVSIHVQAAAPTPDPATRPQHREHTSPKVVREGTLHSCRPHM